MDQRLPEPAVTDWRGLCEELLEALASTGEAASGSFVDLRDRARLALAQPEPEVAGPSDEELDDLFTEIDQGGEPLSWLAFARAVLARWGRPAPAPAGEVGELVAWLREQATWFAADDPGHENYDRAADLLERQAAMAPAGEVEKRLRQLAGDEELMVYYWPENSGSWEINYGNPSPHVMLGEVGGVYSTYGATLQEAVDKLAALLPAHALPLPSGEVE